MKKRSVFWGIFFILATILLIASQLVSFTTINFWGLLATVVLAAIIIQSCIYRMWGGLFVPLSLIYLIFQTPLGWPYIAPWILIIAAILLSIGFHFLFRSRPKKYIPHHHGFSDGRHSDVSQNEDDNNPVISVKFGSVVRYLRSDCLRAGRFSSHFGSMEVYFDNARLAPEGAELFLECSFGAIKLYIPRSWPVEDRTQNSVGSVDFKNLSATDSSLPRLTLTGNVSMAGVEIIYI